MARDNLITEGRGYDHEPARCPYFNASWLDLVELALLALIAVLKALQARRLAGHRPWSFWPKSETWFFSSPYPSWLLVMLVLIGVCVLLSWNNITPVNVLGIVLLSLVLFSERIEAFFDRER